MAGRESVDSLIKQLEALRIQEERVLRRLVAARARETEADGFSVGNRVVITNRISPIFGRNVNINDRRAVITEVTDTKIHFRTINGTTTWRLRKNLRLVPRDEVWEE